MFKHFFQVSNRAIRVSIDRWVRSSVSIGRGQTGQGDPTILVAIGIAGAAGYVGPGLLEKLPLPNRAQLVTSSSVETLVGRFVSNCIRADGASVQRWLFRNGHAMDWPRYSNGAFAKERPTAKAERIGIWQGQFELPWEWRATHREPAASEQSSSCNIKGNISRKGERIYHVQGQKYYAQTRISTGKGERWFCSEQEARAAGWRRSQQ